MIHLTTLSLTEFSQCRVIGRQVGCLWKKAVVAKFKVLCWYLPEVIKNSMLRVFAGKLTVVGQLKCSPLLMLLEFTTLSSFQNVTGSSGLLCQLYTAHILTSYLLPINFNIILSCTFSSEVDLFIFLNPYYRKTVCTFRIIYA